MQQRLVPMNEQDRYMTEKRSMQFMEVERKVHEYLKSCWVATETVHDRSQAWWASASDKVHPKLRITILVLGDVTGWAILLIGGFGVVALGVLCCVLILGVLLAPYLYLTLFLGLKYLTHRSTLVYALVALGGSNAALYALWWLPESDVLGRKYKINETDFSAEKLLHRFQIVSMLVLFLGGSIYAAVFSLDLLVILGAIVFIVYYVLHNSYSFVFYLATTIPWYALLPLTVCTPLLGISLYRRLKAESNKKDVREKQKVELPSTEYQVIAPVRLPV